MPSIALAKYLTDTTRMPMMSQTHPATTQVAMSAMTVCR